MAGPTTSSSGFRLVDDEPIVPHTIVELRARETGPRQVDRTIAEIALRNQGLYSAGLHRDTDPLASAEFIQSHVRRLEAMRRQGLAERLPDERWHVEQGHLDRAERFESPASNSRPLPFCGEGHGNAGHRSSVPHVRAQMWRGLI
jgi:hypothetical protein